MKREMLAKVSYGLAAAAVLAAAAYAYFFGALTSALNDAAAVALGALILGAFATAAFAREWRLVAVYAVAVVVVVAVWLAVVITSEPVHG